MMVGPAKLSWNAHLNTDWRKRVSFGFDFDHADERIGRGGRRQIRANVNIRPSDNFSISFNPSHEVSKSGNQYVAATSALAYEPTFGSRYIFSDLDRTTVSMETRLNWTFSPTLTLSFSCSPCSLQETTWHTKQLAESQTYSFTMFTSGLTEEHQSGVSCSSSSCETVRGWDDIPKPRLQRRWARRLLFSGSRLQRALFGRQLSASLGVSSWVDSLRCLAAQALW